MAGKLDSQQGTFSITTLIVPKQEGTSDTVQALAEEEIFEAQDSRGLYPMGWIHTHPTQTCFLSSIDVHTQCGYQASIFNLTAGEANHFVAWSSFSHAVAVNLPKLPV